MPDRGVERCRRIWVLTGDKAGDNAQVRIVARALGWPFEERYIAMRPEWALGKPRVRPSLDHIDAGRSDPLEPPWPDLVIAIGRRLSMVALWIRERSGDRSRLVLIGKPRRMAERFDLIVASAQYRIEERPNVLRLEFPLMRIDPDAVAAAADSWRARLEHLPRPLTAVFLGGATKAIRFDVEAARELASQLARSATGGSLYVTSSRRTPPEVVDALAAELPEGTPVFRWKPDATDNPYLALLGLADRFVVTSDSITMMIEVARLGRPLAIFLLPPAHGRLWRWWRALVRGRDLEAVPQLLIERGLAARLGEPVRPPAGPVPDDLLRVVERIRSLLDPAEERIGAGRAAV